MSHFMSHRGGIGDFLPQRLDGMTQGMQVDEV
jgi:hypothetical protein